MGYSNLFFFVEEPSIIPLIEKMVAEIAPRVNFRIFPHQGKQDLERSLPKTIPSISLLPNTKIIVIRDQDSDDCIILKNRLDSLMTRNCHCHYLIRIACKEMESWFLGDLLAIKSAFPRFKPESYMNKSMFRDVDKIINPSDKLKGIIGQNIVSKRLLSQKISPHLNIEENKSTSFNHLKAAIERFASE